MANGAIALRDAMSRASDSLAKTRERAERHGKEALAQSQKLVRLQGELKAQERSRKEAERRAGESVSRVSQLEAELKTVQERVEEQARQLGQAQERSVAARGEIEAAARRATVAEEAAVKAGQHAAKAVARAEEAKAHAYTLEDELKKAKAEAEEAVEKYKSSPEFTKELVESGLDAFMKGFDTGKARVSTVLKIDSAEIDKVQLADEEESAEEGDDEAGAGADEP